MTDQTAAGAEAGATASTPDPDAERYAAAFAEEGITPADAKPAAEPAEKPAEPLAEKPPLPPEELAKRHEDVKAALREERRQRKELARQVEQLRTQRAQPAPAAQTQPQPQSFERPDPETDPLGYLKYVEARIAAGDQQAEQQEQHRQQAEAQNREVQTIVNRMVEIESDFALDNPDYYDAANFLRAERAKEYTALGYSPQQAEQLVAQEALRVSADLLNQRRDPASAFYELAKARGYRSGAAPAPASTPASAQTTDALSRIKAGQEASKTLSGTGGGSTNKDLDVGHINTLKGAAFDASFEKLREAARAAERRTRF